MGAMILHGLHQSAQRSTETGVVEYDTSGANVLSVTSCTFPMIHCLLIDACSDPAFRPASRRCISGPACSLCTRDGRMPNYAFIGPCNAVHRATSALVVMKIFGEASQPICPEAVGAESRTSELMPPKLVGAELMPPELIGAKPMRSEAMLPEAMPSESVRSEPMSPEAMSPAACVPQPWGCQQ